MKIKMRKFSLKKMIVNAGYLILLVTIMINILGIIHIKYASYNFKEKRYYSFPIKQSLWSIIGISTCLGIMLIDYKILVRKALFLYIFGIFLLILTAYIGVIKNNSKRWIKVGPILFQTSELMKIVIILMLANIVSRFKIKEDFSSFLIPFVVTFIPMGLIIKQPDLGTSLVFLPIVFSIVFIAEVRYKHLIILIIAMGIIGIYGVFFLLKDYQRERILTFLSQNKMTKEQQKGEGYHLLQSKIAHGAGGFAGRSEERATQIRYKRLPEAHTDFIFATVGEIHGFLGTLIILFLYIILYTSLLQSAIKINDIEGRAIIIGVSVLLFTQTVVNTYMTVGLAPITGLPLPFMSYGGSSLLFSYISIGLVISVLSHE